MSISNISFTSYSEKITLCAYEGLKSRSTFLAEVIGRLSAALFLSLGAALDIAFHALFFFPSCLYAIGKSVILWRWDFSIPWEHLQRVRNALAPLIFGSVLGLIHPYAGIFLSEGTDKHIALGMLASNKESGLNTPCSPIRTYEMVTAIAKDNKAVFPQKHIEAIESVASYEKTLQSLQAQEFIHKLTNTTLYTMAAIKFALRDSDLSLFWKETFLRISGILIPILTVFDFAIGLLLQGFFLTTGLIRCLGGKGPLYTEVTTNPLMHIALLIQNVLKTVGNLIGNLVWFVSPMSGFKTSLIPSNAFFNLQMSILMHRIKGQMHNAKEGDHFMIPISYFNGANSLFSIPTANMHSTYLIIEKKNELFNLYWVNRPDVSERKRVSSDECLQQIRSMFDERFPFMDIERLMDFPVESKEPELVDSYKTNALKEQGTHTNCVVSNLFGALEVLDGFSKDHYKLAPERYKTVRETLSKTYGFLKTDFHPYTEDFSINSIWDEVSRVDDTPI